MMAIILLAAMIMKGVPAAAPLPTPVVPVVEAPAGVPVEAARNINPTLGSVANPPTIVGPHPYSTAAASGNVPLN